MTPGFPKKLAVSAGALCLAAAAIYSLGHPDQDASAKLGSTEMLEPSTASSVERSGKDGDANQLLEELKSLTASAEIPDFQAFQAAIRSLVKFNPEAASEFAASLENGSTREIALHRVAQAWAGRNPQAAARWANGLRNQEERGMLLNGIFGEVAQGDPAKAIQMAETYDMLSFSPGMTANLVQQWASRDYDSALQWTEALAPGAAREEMLARLAVVRCATSPEEAASLISDQISNGSSQEEAAITIISRWAATDPEAARAWACSFEAGELRERALKEVDLAAVARRNE
jgi:hypothetical protein